MNSVASVADELRSDGRGQVHLLPQRSRIDRDAEHDLLEPPFWRWLSFDASHAGRAIANA